jgi:N-carbamoylputrescine amidase
MTSKPRIVQLAMIQMSCTKSQKENTEKAIAKVEQAASRGANIVCLQELFNAPYPCQSEDYERFAWAEAIPGPTSIAMSDVAKKLGIVVTGSVFERRAHGLYHNTAVVYDTDGSLCGFYRKMHIPDDPLYYEKFYFTPGDTGFTVAETKFGKIGVGVCWDQWYPEAARLFALKGAEILLYPTAIGWFAPDKPSFGKSQHEAWETMMRSHAIANGLFVGAANRVGVEDELAGNLLHRAKHDAEEIVLAECNLDAIDAQRTHWPFLRDRRIDAYQDLTRRWIDAT